MCCIDITVAWHAAIVSILHGSIAFTFCYLFWCIFLCTPHFLPNVILAHNMSSSNKMHVIYILWFSFVCCNSSLNITSILSYIVYTCTYALCRQLDFACSNIKIAFLAFFSEWLLCVTMYINKIRDGDV